jgi:hypothetical protein
MYVCIHRKLIEKKREMRVHREQKHSILFAESEIIQRVSSYELFPLSEKLDRNNFFFCEML